MKKRMKQKYPKMKIASVQPGEENLQKGIDVTKSYLSANPDTTGVFGITTVALPGVAEAVRQLGLTGKVAVTGLTDPVIAKPYIDAGVVEEGDAVEPRGPRLPRRVRRQEDDRRHDAEVAARSRPAASAG